MEQIQKLSENWRMAPVVKALQAMRGVSTIVATTTVAELGDLDRAIVDYSQAIRLQPAHFAAYIYRGGAYAANGEQVKAEADFTKAKELGHEPPE